MKTRLDCLLWAALVLSACGTAEEPQDAAPQAAPVVDEVAAVRALAESWDPIANAEDLDGMMRLFAPDSVRLNAGEPALVGSEALRADFAAGYAASDVVGSNPVDEVQVAGSWAFARGTYAGRSTAADTGAVTEEKGKWVSIFRKTADGWKYHIDSWNLDAPGGAATSAGASEPVNRGELPPAVTPSSPAEEAILADGVAWDTANNAADVDALVALYAADAIRMADAQPMVKGTEALRASFEAGFAAQTPNGVGVTRGLEVEGDWAYAWGTWTDRPTIKATGEVREETGKWINVLRASPEGWKLYLELWNRDTAPSSL